jgi:hypothetical protein
VRYTLTGNEVINLVAKYAPKEYPVLEKYDGMEGHVTLKSVNGDFECILEIKEPDNH